MKKRVIGIPEIAFIILGFLFISGIIVYLNLLMPISTQDIWKEIKIPKGASYSQGIDILKNNGLVNNKKIFLMLARITKTDRKLGAGYYNLNHSMSPWEIFDRLRKGKIVNYTITIPEGATLDDIKALFADTGLIDDNSWDLVHDREFLASLNIDAPSLEGYLFPDTYIFAKGANPGDILSIMVQRLREKFDEQLQDRALDMGMSERKILTLASIIEKEALFNKERPVISAVYHNRLKINMRLQADPTVVYGIKKIQDGITRSDLKRKTRYNTYVNYGLPPGPIASPGIRSIKAALYPSNVSYIYFVSKNDGTHHFSETGEEHLEAVILYQRKKRKPAARKKEDISDVPGDTPETQEYVLPDFQSDAVQKIQAESDLVKQAIEFFQRPEHPIEQTANETEEDQTD
jgi:UPF0755 protein